MEETKQLKERLTQLLVFLIEQKNVKNFLFGSRSEFNTFCYKVVTELKERYPELIRKQYPCRSEVCALIKDKGQIYENEKYGYVLWVEEEVDHKTKYTSGKAQYVERNQAMIDDSDYCIFYYNALYQPPLRRNSKKDLAPYQPNSGTEAVLEYAYRKKRNGKLIDVFNVFQE